LISTNAVNPVPPETVHRAHAGLEEYRAYVHELAERQRREPSESQLVGELLDASQADRLTEDELAAMYVLLLFAGHETTANLIGNGLRAFLHHPEQWARLCADPSLAATASEEALRYDSPVQFFGKLVGVDTELAGVTLPAGTTVMVGNASANRDPRAFEGPDTFDIGRHPNEQLAFGLGIHFCLGAPVARLEGRIAFETLARRFPDLEPAVDPAELEYRRHVNLRGLISIPVRLGDDRGY
jgi:cytochrome P450